MVCSGCRQWIATVAAGAVLGLVLPAPLHAQQARPAMGAGTISRAALATLSFTDVGEAQGVSCCNLDGYTTYAVMGTRTLPACFILVPPKASAVQPGGLEALGKRFVRAYKLTGYRIAPAKDNSALFLFHEERIGSIRPQGLKAMVYEKTPASVVRWLNATCGGSPHRMEGTRLVWRSAVAPGNNKREMEISLDLLQPMPCYADIRLRNINLSSVNEALSGQLGLELKPVSGSKGSALRKKLGVKPMGCMEDKYLSGSLVLVRAAGENGLYRLGAPEALAAVREQRGQAAPRPLPELSRCTWVDATGTAQDATNAAQPAQEPTIAMGSLRAQDDSAALEEPAAQDAPAPAPAGSSDEDDYSMFDPARKDPGKAPADAQPTAAPRPATPAEAREAYAERLRAL